MHATLTAQAVGQVWNYQWYVTPSVTGVEQLVPGANSSQYEFPVDCASDAIYRVQVNCGANSAEARGLVTPRPSVWSTTLQILPNGAGPWTYSWSRSTDGVTWSPITPNAAVHTLPLGDTYDYAYYKATAHSSGGNAEITAHVYSDCRDLGNCSVARVGAPINATMAVYFHASARLGLGAAWHWFFTPASGGAEIDTGITTSALTINPVDCGAATTGSYRAQVTDNCGGVYDAPRVSLNACETQP
jgi:hypothetical protein